MIYTTLYIQGPTAEKLFKEFASKPLEPGESGCVTEATFKEHFRKYSVTHLRSLAAQLQRVDNEPDTYCLEFQEYLSELPHPIRRMADAIKRVEIRRYNSMPTEAQPGYYEAPALNLVATVEATIPFSDNKATYVQNIAVAGETLGAAQRFNTLLSTGCLACFLVNAF